MIFVPLIGYSIITILTMIEYKKNYDESVYKYYELLFIGGYLLLVYNYFEENETSIEKEIVIKSDNNNDNKDVLYHLEKTNELNYAHIILGLYYVLKMIIINEINLLNFCMLLAHIILIYMKKNRIGIFVYILGYLLEMKELFETKEIVHNEIKYLKIISLCSLIYHYSYEIIEETKKIRENKIK